SRAPTDEAPVVLAPLESADPTTAGSSASPGHTSPPTTSAQPGHPTNITEINTRNPERPSPEKPTTPSPGQSTLSAPVTPGVPILGPVNSTLLEPALTTGHMTSPSTLRPTNNDPTAKVNVSGVSTVTKGAASLKGIVTTAPMTTGQKTDREVACSFPTAAAADVESTVTPHLAPSTVRVTTLKPPSMTLREASSVICVMGRIGVSIEKAFLKIMSITSHSLFLGSPECSINCTSDTHIYIEAGWKECKTKVDS
ncbi:uncharacterized protein RB166_021593, partial [Leptodactylus fuscus]